ncbi:MAG: geranylgeranylglycerol-phosphate geranylgeranyltransferase [Halobacteria archaeon]|nr:geranylgeranylglycerol-phosphate geranylgeranyltransferase [Halobacteria archaeon]
MAQTKVRSLIEITRPTNSLFGGVATLIGAYIGGIVVVPTVIASVVTIMGTGAGNAINDYFDAEIDEINRPDRPIPSGRVSGGEAVILSAILLAVALITTVVTLPPLAIAIGIVNLFALVGYSSHLKRKPFIGNLTVGYLTGSAFLFGGAAVGGIKFTLVLFLLALLATLGREIVKDVEDMKGDMEVEAKTLPIIWGKKRSLSLATFFVVVAVALSPVPYFFEIFGLDYIVAVVPADLLLLAGIWASWGKPSKGQKLLKVGMFVAMFAFVAARFIA